MSKNVTTEELQAEIAKLNAELKKRQDAEEAARMSEMQKLEAIRQASVKEKSAEIAKHVSAAYASLAKAQALAEEYKISFNFEPAYGMGGSYDKDWDASDDDDAEYKWHSSSLSC